MEVVVDRPRVPTKGRISRLKNGERATVEVGHIVVDPLSLPKLIVSTEVRRQPHCIAYRKRAARISGYSEGSPIALHVGDSYRPILSRT